MNSLYKLSVFTLLLLFSFACIQVKQPAESTESAIGLLQHNVYFYLNEDVTEAEKAAFEEGLEMLMSIEEVHTYQLGTPGNTPDRDVTNNDFGYSIFSWFSSMEDYEVYAEHPVHLEFIEQYSDLWAEVRVYDSEVISASE